MVFVTPCAVEVTRLLGRSTSSSNVMYPWTYGVLGVVFGAHSISGFLVQLNSPLFLTLSSSRSNTNLCHIRGRTPISLSLSHPRCLTLAASLSQPHSGCLTCLVVSLSQPHSRELTSATGPMAMLFTFSISYFCTLWTIKAARATKCRLCSLHPRV